MDKVEIVEVNNVSELMKGTQFHQSCSFRLAVGEEVTTRGQCLPRYDGSTLALTRHQE